VSTADDRLLDVFDQFTNALYWHQQRSAVTAADAIVEAVNDWLMHHASQPQQAAPVEPAEPLGAAFAQLVAAGTGADGVTVAEALTEAIADWVAVASAEHHQSLPFRR